MEKKKNMGITKKALRELLFLENFSIESLEPEKGANFIEISIPEKSGKIYLETTGWYTSAL